MALNEKQLKAIPLIANGMSQKEASKTVGVTEATMNSWCWRNVEFRNYLKEVEAEVFQQVVNSGIAIKELRVKAKKDRYDALMEIQKERSEDNAYGFIPGYNTGYIVVKETPSKDGSIYHHSVDKNLLDALSKIEEEIAIELGQRVTKTEVKVEDKSNELEEYIDKTFNAIKEKG